VPATLVVLLETPRSPRTTASRRRVSRRPGSHLAISQGYIGPNGQIPASSGTDSYFNGMLVPALCQKANDADNTLSSLAAHGYRGT
jgi:hypothetical protein